MIDDQQQTALVALLGNLEQSFRLFADGAEDLSQRTAAGPLTAEQTAYIHARLEQMKRLLITFEGVTRTMQGIIVMPDGPLGVS